LHHDDGNISVTSFAAVPAAVSGNAAAYSDARVIAAKGPRFCVLTRSKFV
jgi:hypothetical protein